VVCSRNALVGDLASTRSRKDELQNPSLGVADADYEVPVFARMFASQCDRAFAVHHKEKNPFDLAAEGVSWWRRRDS
jgi:hypothetical protein